MVKTSLTRTGATPRGADGVASLWPKSVVPDSRLWTSRCFRQLVRRDPRLDQVDALGIATDMATERWCRAMQPEAAADRLFRPSS
jgi:hypothetical protein